MGGVSRLETSASLASVPARTSPCNDAGALPVAQLVVGAKPGAAGSAITRSTAARASVMRSGGGYRRMDHPQAEGG